MVIHMRNISKPRCVPRSGMIMEYPPCIELAKDLFCCVFDWFLFPGACGYLKVLA